MKKLWAKWFATELYVEKLAVSKLYWQLYLLHEALARALNHDNYSSNVNYQMDEASKLLLMLRGRE